MNNANNNPHDAKHRVMLWNTLWQICLQKYNTPNSTGNNSIPLNVINVCIRNLLQGLNSILYTPFTSSFISFTTMYLLMYVYIFILHILMQSKTTQKGQNSNEFLKTIQKRNIMLIIMCVSYLIVLTVVLSLDWWATLRGWWLSIPVKKESCCNDRYKPARGDICVCESSHTTRTHIHKCTLNRQSTRNRLTPLSWASSVCCICVLTADTSIWQRSPSTHEASYHKFLSLQLYIHGPFHTSWPNTQPSTCSHFQQMHTSSYTEYQSQFKVASVSRNKHDYEAKQTTTNK